MKQIQKLYYQQKGIRFPDGLASIPLISFDSLPKLSAYHNYGGLDASSEVDSSLPIYQGYNKKILLVYVEQFSETPIGGRMLSFNLKNAYRDFRIKNKAKWEIAQDTWKTNHDTEALVVLNYGYLDEIYRFIDSPISNYHRQQAVVKTILKNASDSIASTGRNQYIPIKLPSILPGMTILNRFSEDEGTIGMAKIVGHDGEGGFMLLDLWRWINIATRSKSVFSAIKNEHFGKVNLVIQGTSGRKMVVNLAYLNSWISGQENTTDLSTITHYSGDHIQKLLLKACMTLNSVVAEENVVIEEPESVVHHEEDVNELVPLEEDLGDASVQSIGQTSPLSYKKPVSIEVIEKNENISAPSLNASLMSEIEKDIAVLDAISLKQMQKSQLSLAPEASVSLPEKSREEIHAQVFDHLSSKTILEKALTAEAEANLITAADYRKINEAIKDYRESPDPYGSKLPRIEAMVIRPEDVLFSKEGSEIAVSDGVPDKSMAKSALQQFDKQYVNHVMKKDILQVVDAIQAAGVVIRRHEVNIDQTILGGYEKHTLELKPVDGAPSTISFTFPVVNEDGTFMSGANKYVLRKQRADTPIRKIAPRMVALSSYYGKTFVQINDKVANDSLAWLKRKINLAGLTEGSYINQVTPGDVFDNELDAPFLYSALAESYTSFRAGPYQFNFDRKRMIEEIGLQTIENIENVRSKELAGRKVCGTGPGGSFLAMQRDGSISQISKGPEKYLGTIYDVLKLEREKSPVSFAEVRVYSKYIPVGVVMSYYLGFSSLLKLLDVPYRTVEPRKQKNLSPEEYAIVFKDKTYIFNQNNRIATLVLSGFSEFEKSIKQFEVELFDHKDVYLNLLMSKGISSIYINELEMMENSFIDPITREILQTMNEPLTFKGLIMRSCELLLTYAHPMSQDRDVMRERGYERFAGALYKELMIATRAFRNKNTSGRSKIEMSPFQVWNAVMKDNSLKIVEDINPIQNLKESEVVTYSGTGGRDKETMTKATRAAHKNDFGITSESTVDSTAVGTIVYLSANPNITGVRGMAAASKEITPTSILSTPALLSPFSTNDN